MLSRLSQVPFRSLSPRRTMSPRTIGSPRTTYTRSLPKPSLESRQYYINRLQEISDSSLIPGSNAYDKPNYNPWETPIVSYVENQVKSLAPAIYKKEKPYANNIGALSMSYPQLISDLILTTYWLISLANPNVDPTGQFTPDLYRILEKVYPNDEITQNFILSIVANRFGKGKHRAILDNEDLVDNDYSVALAALAFFVGYFIFDD